jgi:hypothetical protein
MSSMSRTPPGVVVRTDRRADAETTRVSRDVGVAYLVQAFDLGGRRPSGAALGANVDAVGGAQ